MRIQMLSNLAGIEKVGKSSKKTDGLFAEVEVTHNLGIIKYLGPEASEQFKVGQKVYFGNKREEIIMESEEILVMEDNNIYAIVEDGNNEETNT